MRLARGLQLKPIRFQISLRSEGFGDTSANCTERDVYILRAARYEHLVQGRTPKFQESDASQAYPTKVVGGNDLLLAARGGGSVRQATRNQRRLILLQMLLSHTLDHSLQ